MTAPACRKGLRRKNGRKANFRQVQTSAARSFGSQSNHIINTASAPKRAPLPSPYPTLRWQSHAELSAHEIQALAPLMGERFERPICGANWFCANGEGVITPLEPDKIIRIAGSHFFGPHKMRTENIVCGVSVIIWMGLFLIGRDLIAGVSDQNVDGYPSFGQIQTYIIFPAINVIFLLAIAWLCNAARRWRRMLILAASISLALLIPYLAVYSGGV